MATTKADEKIAKLQSRLAVARREAARQRAAAAARVAGKAKQCAMITFNVLREARPDVLEWVEAQLKRDQDKRAFQEWRATLERPAADPSVDPVLLASSAP